MQNQSNFDIALLPAKFTSPNPADDLPYLLTQPFCIFHFPLAAFGNGSTYCCANQFTVCIP